ncbi:MAG: O-antigen ligase family protein [Cyanobacteria bacterium J06614_10]
MNSLSSSPAAALSPAAPRQARLELIEKSYSVFTWLFFSNGVGTVLSNTGPLLTLLRYGILLMGLLLIAARWRATLRALAKGWLLWLLVALMVCSLGWSMTPSYTMESIRGEVLPMSVFAIYFSSRFNMREQMRLVAIALGIGAVLSLFYALAIPSVGRHVGGTFDGAWKGVYSQKNNFSTTMTLTILTYFVLSIVNTKGLEKRLSQIGLLGSIAMVILSTSKSGLLIFITILLIVMLARLFRWQGRRSVLVLDLAGLGLLIAIALLSVTWQQIVIGLGKDPTLSARTFIWSGAIDKVMDRPWLGYGRAAFWVPNSLPARQVGALADSGDFVPAHAHNGFIDVAIDLGLVGFGLFMLGLLATYFIALRRAYQAKTPEDLWPFAFLTLMAMSNMTETVLMNRVTLYWVLYMVMFLSVRLWPPRTPMLEATVESGLGSIESNRESCRENGVVGSPATEVPNRVPVAPSKFGTFSGRD